MRQEAFFTAASQFYRWPRLHIASSLFLGRWFETIFVLPLHLGKGSIMTNIFQLGGSTTNYL